MYESAPTVSLHMTVYNLKLAITLRENWEVPMGTQKGTQLGQTDSSSHCRAEVSVTLYGYVQSKTNYVRMHRSNGRGKSKLHLLLNQTWDLVKSSLI